MDPAIGAYGSFESFDYRRAAVLSFTAVVAATLAGYTTWILLTRSARRPNRPATSVRPISKFAADPRSFKVSSSNTNVGPNAAYDSPFRQVSLAASAAAASQAPCGGTQPLTEWQGSYGSYHPFLLLC